MTRLLVLLLLAAPAAAQDAALGGPVAALAASPADDPLRPVCLVRDDEGDDEAEEDDRLVVFAGLRRTRDLPTEVLRLVRRELLDGLPVHVEDLRALAAQRDGLAAQCLVRVLLRDRDADPLEVARLAALATGTGRTWTLPALLSALLRLDPAVVPPEDVALFTEVVYAHAWAGDARALDAVIDLNGPGRLFGELSEATRARILEVGARAGDGRAALRLALTDLRTPGGEAHARAALALALDAGEPATRAMAATLLGRLDASDSWAEPTG